MFKRGATVGLCGALASLALAAGLGLASPSLNHAAAIHAPSASVDARTSDAESPTQPGPTGQPPAADTLRQFVNDQSSRLSQQPASGAPGLNAAAAGAALPTRLTRGVVTGLAARCAPSTPTSALVSIAQVESGLAPLAIRINHSGGRVLSPADKASAIASAQALIDQGRNVDLGLAQINSRNLGWLGLSVADAFDPCRNLAAAAQILDRGYAEALQVDRTDRPILQMAYSLYNSGDVARGWSNGYVAKVEAARRQFDQ